MALKIINAIDQQDFNNYSKEIVYMYSLDHLNIVKIYDYYFHTQIQNNSIKYQIMFVMEKADMSLKSYIKQMNNNLSDLQIMKMMRSLTSAIEYAHHKKTVYCDLKLDNILVFGDEFKITDSGNDTNFKIFTKSRLHSKKAWNLGLFTLLWKSENMKMMRRKRLLI